MNGWIILEVYLAFVAAALLLIACSWVYVRVTGGVGWKVRLELKAADCWLGVFPRRRTNWRDRQGKAVARIDLWICLIPMLPIHCWWFQRLGAATKEDTL